MQPSEDENADTPHLQSASQVQNSDTGPQKFIRIESEDVVVLNPDDPVPLPIPIKPEDSSGEDNLIIKEEFTYVISCEILHPKGTKIER